MPQYDASVAQCVIYSFKDGLLSKLAHDVKYRATRFSIDVDDARRAVRASVDAQSVRVVCVMRDGVETTSGLGAADKAKIEAQIVDDVLDENRHPSIDFQSTSVTAVPQGYRIEGTLRLHGREQSIVTIARLVDGEFWAEMTLHQPDFGIKPFSAMLGALKVKPEVVVRVMVPAVG